MKSYRNLDIGSLLIRKYKIDSILGTGLTGIVYLCYDINIYVKVAIKEYFPRDIADRNGSNVIPKETFVNEYEIGLKSFKNEAILLSKLYSISGIISYKHFFQSNNTAYIVMEYFEGITLEKYLEKHKGDVSLKEKISLIEKISIIVDKVHQKGWIHRDITPENIMISSWGQIRLIDFGNARNIDENKKCNNHIKLTPGYAAIEQYDESMEGPWTDIYSLSAILYRMFIEQTPPTATKRKFSGDCLSNKLFKNREILKIIEKGMELDRFKRYQNVHEFQKQLSKISSIINISLIFQRARYGCVFLAFIIVLLNVVISTIKINDLEKAQSETHKKETVQYANVSEQQETSKPFNEITENKLIQDIESRDIGYVYKSYYEDFDGDGIREMMALVISNDVPYDEMKSVCYNDFIEVSCTNYEQIDGILSFYFANENGVKKISEDFNIYDTRVCLHILEFFKEKGLLVEVRQQLDYYKEMFLFSDEKVQGINMKYFDKFNTIDLSDFRNQDGMLYLKSKYSLQLDENYKDELIRIIPEIGTAYYEDEIPFRLHNGKLYECASIKVPVEHFMEYNNAISIMKEIEQEGKKLNLITSQFLYDQGYDEGYNIEECELQDIWYAGNGIFYINYIIKNFVYVTETYPACTAKVHLENNQLFFDNITPGIHYEKISLLPAYYPEYEDKKEKYVDQTEEEFYVWSVLTTTDGALLDYKYDDFNSDGIFELFAVVSCYGGVSSQVGFNGRHHYEGPFEIWQMNDTGCKKIDVDITPEISQQTHYAGYLILQFGMNFQINLIIVTDARTGEAYQGVILAYDAINGFYESLRPQFSIEAKDGVAYYYCGTDTIDTPFYGTGYTSFLQYPIYYIDGQYYEIASTEINVNMLEELENWKLVELNIQEQMQRKVGDYHAYPCYNGIITNVFFNEIGKVYVNYEGTTYLEGFENMVEEPYPRCYVTAELTIKGNRIESYEVKAGKRESNGSSAFNIISSNVASFYQQ